MFGSSQTQAQTQTVASGVDIQSSCYGGVVPVIYGRARLTGNLIWYGDFQAIAVQSADGNGGKGGDSSHGATTYDYKASFIFALGEGPLGGVDNVWASKAKKAFVSSNLTFASGSLGQAPWGYLTTKYPSQALGYSSTAYVYAAAYDLGSSAQLPNLSYEVTGLLSGMFPSGVTLSSPDCDPGAVIADILFNSRYGVGFPAARISYLGFLNFSQYCIASGLVISPVFDTQSDAASQLNTIVQSCNAEFVWTGTQLTIVPYGDQNLSANGASYSAPSAPLFSLTDDDFLYRDGQDPVQLTRARPSDQMNAIRFEFLDRAHDYNANIVEAKNQAAIEAYGLRGEQPEQMHHFCDANAAKLAATLKLQRQSVRNVYTFTLGWRYCLLDPMDIVDITDGALGLDRQWVRILSLEEDDNGNIKVTAEEYLGGTGHAPLYDFEPGTPPLLDYNVDPGSVNAPLIFEPPPVMLAARSVAAPQIMIGACGGTNWGGCEVHLSLDGSTYKRIGRINAPSRMGTLTADLASGGDPDTTRMLAIDLGESGRAVQSGTPDDLNAFRTLCYVDGELVAYQTATLTGNHAYSLTTLRRGVYGSTVAAHAAGSMFCRLDESVKSFDLPITPVSYVGKTLYLKFPSFNIYGGALQDISTLSPYGYTPGGSGVYVFPPTAISFSVGAEQQGDGTWISFGVVAWTATQDPLFDQYEVQYRLHTGPGPWISWRGGKDTTSFRISPLAPNTAYDVQVRAVRTSGPFYSGWDQALNITSATKTTAPPAPTGLTCIGGYRQIAVRWTASAENDVSFYEVWSGASNVLGSATLIGKVNGTKFIDTGLGLSDTRYYWVRAQDTSGNYSTYLGPGTATSNAVTSSDLTGTIVGSQIAAAAIAGANLADNIIDIGKIAGGYGLPAYWTGASLPGSGNALSFNGSILLWSHDGRLYRYSNTLPGWQLAVDGGDLSAGSITTNTISAGSITAPLIASDAVTAEKLFIGDTTNLVLDDMFADSAYWFLTDPVGGVTSLQAASGTNAAATMGALNAVQVSTSNIPSGSSQNFGGLSTYIPVKQGLSYRASCTAHASGSGVNQNGTLFIVWYDATKTQIGTFQGADGPRASGGYAPGDTGDDGNVFTAGDGAVIVNTATAPSGACYARVFPCVHANGTAGTGTAWWFTHARLERQAVGTLIENGAITTSHITAAGIDGSVITAGTITGDRMTSNFIDSQVFQTAAAAGQPFIEINGKAQTILGHLNGPWFRVNDGTYDRVIIGRLQGAWGMWINDASGDSIFVESETQTKGLAQNALVVPYSWVNGGTVSCSAGSYTPLWSQAVTIGDTSTVMLTMFLLTATSAANYRIRGATSGTIYLGPFTNTLYNAKFTLPASETLILEAESLSPSLLCQVLVDSVATMVAYQRA
jgi:hypothetical protein